MNGSFFQNFPKFDSKVAKINEIFAKSGNFAQNLVQNCSKWNKNGSLKKKGICMGLLSNSMAGPAHPYHNRT